MFSSPRFRKIFLIRFLGHFFIITGLLVVSLSLEPVLAEEVKYRTNQLLGKRFVVQRVVTSSGEVTNPKNSQGEALNPNEVSGSGGFGSILSSQPETIVPVSTEFGIVIEKIGANAQVIANVDPSIEGEYTQALSKGVAHAKGTVFPGQKGNIYLFSHSVDAPWNIVRYNAIFYLLGKLERGDRVVMFYKGRRFDYIVFDKAIVPPTDTRFLTDTYNQSILTLQTCDPPGTLLNRLIIRAKLASD